jgi:hypothetical protein
MTHTGEPSYQPIEIDGIFLGAAVPHALGVSFIAADRHVADMDNSIWPTLGYARSAAAQLYRTTRTGGPRIQPIGGLSRHGLAVVRWMARRAKTILQAGK